MDYDWLLSGVRALWRCLVDMFDRLPLVCQHGLVSAVTGWNGARNDEI